MMAKKQNITIPQADPLAGYKDMKRDIDTAMKRVLESGAYVLGHEVEMFEREFALWLRQGHAVGVGSGTDLCDPSLGLINRNYTNPAVGNTAGDGQWSNGDPFIALWTGSGYWSSTENTGDPTKSWYVEMYDGSIYPVDKSVDSALVWPVRDPL